MAFALRQRAWRVDAKHYIPHISCVNNPSLLFYVPDLNANKWNTGVDLENYRPSLLLAYIYIINSQQYQEINGNLFLYLQKKMTLFSIIKHNIVFANVIFDQVVPKTLWLGDCLKITFNTLKSVILSGVSLNCPNNGI